MKISKKQQRRKNLENLILKKEYPYCKKHKEYLDMTDIYVHRCWLGHHGRSYCQYLRLRT